MRPGLIQFHAILRLENIAGDPAVVTTDLDESAYIYVPKPGAQRLPFLKIL